MISNTAILRKYPAYAGIIYPVLSFGGGLNTKASLLTIGQGQRYSLRPDQTTILDNLIRTSSGMLRTRPGRVKLNSTPVNPPVGDSEIRSIFELRRSDGTDFILINAGNTVYKWNGSAFISLGTVGTANKRMQWAQFQDTAIGVDGVNAPVEWDGTTFGALAGTPPSPATAVCSYRNRVWMIKGRTLYYCALGNSHDWTTLNNAGSVPIPTTLGKGGTALIPMWNRLIILCDQQVFELVGADPATFTIDAISFRYGHQGNSAAAIAAANDIYFINARGCQALSVTNSQSETGDIVYNYQSGVIEPTWQDITPGNLPNIAVVNDALRNLLIFACNQNGTTNNEALVADYYHLDDEGRPTWSRYSNWSFSSMCLVYSLNALPEVLMGDYSGTVYRQTDDATDDAGVVIPIQLQYVTDANQPGFLKTWRHMLLLAQSENATLNVTNSYDFGARVRNQAVDISLPGGDILGTTFTIGVSSLGSVIFGQKRVSIPGHGRYLTVNINGSSSSRITIGGFVLYADTRRVIGT